MKLAFERLEAALNKLDPFSDLAGAAKIYTYIYIEREIATSPVDIYI